MTSVVTRDEYDAIIIGSGATGGWAAKELTSRGLSVLVLEAGPTLRTSDLEPRTPRAPDWDATRAVQKRHPACTADTYHLFVDEAANPYTTPADRPFDWIRARQVGGRSVMWGGVTFRLSDLDFKAASHDGFGMDWPISYDEVAPYYDEVETFLGICGTPEGLPQLPDGKFVAAPSMTDGEKHFKQAVERRWSDRRVTSGRAILHRSRPDLDPGWLMRTSTGSTLAAARATGHMELRSGAIVHRIVIDATSGRARGVAFLDAETRAEHEVRGRIVMLGASTIETIRLMFNSAMPRHPHGIGNAAGLLGRYLMDHTRVAIVGVCPGLTGELGPAFAGYNSIYVPRFRNVRERDPRFIRGYGMFAGIQRHGIPKTGADDAAPFAISIHGEQLAIEDNRVTIDPDVKDAWGIPVPRIDCRYGDNERLMAEDALDCAREMIGAAGFEITRQFTNLMNPGWIIHEVGGARMGNDPQTSVVDRDHRVWDCPNLFVIDGAVWVSAASQNPTLTMMALALRAARRAADALAKREL